MNNSSLIQVKVQDLNEDKKIVKQRRLIYQKIKPFMEAYGLHADLFELKGKQVVFKANNSINTSQLSRSGATSKSVIIANKARKISVKKKNQNQQRQIIAPMDYSPLTISEKYAQLFAELQSHPEHTKAASAVQPSSIPEEADEITDNSTIKKQVLSEIAELDQIKQQKLEELQNLEQKIQDLQGLEHNILSNRQFVIRQPTLRQKKDKAASLIQAHIKGRIDQRRYQEWKQHKQQKLDKLTKIQQWWKLILRRKLISKKLLLTHVNKQIKEIGGCTFIVFSNYSHPLKRIRILLIQRNGLMKQNYRFYLNFDNIQNILTEQPQISSFEFNNLLDLITSNLFKIFQIHNNQIVMDLISKNIFYIERLLLSINITLTQLQHDQYEIKINRFDEEEEVYQEENSHNLEENFDEKQSQESKEQLQADDQEVKQLSPIENVQISEAEAIQEQQLSYQYDQEIVNKKLNDNQEDLREQIQINDPLIDNHQSQLSDTKPDNEEQLEYVTENYQIDQQIKESPKQEKQHQFREESLNSEFIESNFQLVNVKKEIAEFDIQQQNQSNDEQDNIKEDEKPLNYLNEQEIYEVPQIQEQDENLKESFVQEEPKSELKQSCQEDNEQTNKEQVDQQEFVESSDNQQIPVDQKVDLIVQQHTEITLEQEKQNNQMIIKLELVGEKNSENQEQNNENTSQIIPEFTSVLKSPFVESQKQCIPLTIPNSEFQLLKSCNSNFDPPVQEINKMLNSNELLLKSENQFTVFKQNDKELNQLLQSEELQRDFSFPAPVVLRHQQQSRKSSTQILELPEQQSPLAESRANSEFKKSQTEEIFKQSVGTTFRVTFNSEFRASVSGFFQSQQFDLTIKQQDSLQYSMDESQEIAPIFITTVQLDEDEIDVYQINDKLRFQDKRGKYNHYDYKIQTISQSNCDYINNQLYIYAINNSLKCLEGCQVLRIQKYVMKYSFVQSCYLIVDNKSYLALLYKSYLRMKIEILLDNNLIKEIILNNCTNEQRSEIKLYFSVICPLLLTLESNSKDFIVSLIEQLKNS